MWHIKMPTNKKELQEFFHVDRMGAFRVDFMPISFFFKHTVAMFKHCADDDVFELNWIKRRLEIEPRKKQNCVLFVCRTFHPSLDFWWIEFSFSILFLFWLFDFFFLSLSAAAHCSPRVFVFNMIFFSLHTCHFPFPIELTFARHKRLNIPLFIFATCNIFPIDVHTESTL